MQVTTPRGSPKSWRMASDSSKPLPGLANLAGEDGHPAQATERIGHAPAVAEGAVQLQALAVQLPGLPVVGLEGRVAPYPEEVRPLAPGVLARLLKPVQERRALPQELAGSFAPAQQPAKVALPQQGPDQHAQQFGPAAGLAIQGLDHRSQRRLPILVPAV